MRILIELPTWLGDAIMSTPAIDNIVNFYNDSEIILIGSFVSTEALKNNYNNASTKVISKKYLDLFFESKKLGKFDIFFSFRNSLRSKFFKYLINSQYKFQLEKKSYAGVHLVEKYNDFINDSLKTDFIAGKLNIVSKNISFSARFKKPLLGINPGASYGDAKRWYPEKFANIAATLSKEYNIIIFGGPSEFEIAKDIEKLMRKKNVINFDNLVNKTSISELIKCISNLDLFITGDSGPMHIAASFEIPTITIFGPTKAEETSQWMNPKSIIVKQNLACQPCMERSCPLGHHNCMKFIEESDVLDAVKKLH
jgi:heptosyltransferase II